MPPQPEGPPPPPVVARVRIRFAKRGRLRFLSHRDIARTFERALRRAKVPTAFSAGFNPHPRISWVGAASTGAASEAEYLEIALAEQCDPGALAAALDAALPPGLDILDCVVALPPTAGAGSLPDRIDASRWRLRMPGVDLADLGPAVAALMARDEVAVDRLMKDGLRSIDVRAGLVSAVVGVDDHACAILDLVVRHTTPAVRPDDVLTALEAVANLQPPVPPEPIRLAQGRLADDGSLADPLAADREGAGRLLGAVEA